jgi:hypothetical protein
MDERERVVALRPLLGRATLLRAVLFRAVVFRAVVFRAVVLRAGVRLAVVFFRAVAFLAVVLRAVLFFRAVAFLAVVLRAVLFFRAVAFLAVVLRAVLFFRAVARFTEVLRAVLFLAVVRRAVLFFAVVLRAVAFFAVVLRAAAFLRGAAFLFEADERFFAELAELRTVLREPERDEDRVVAGMAGATSMLSELDASSSVIKRPPGSVARARFPTTLLCTVQRGQHESCARWCKRKRGFDHVVRAARTRYAN